MQSSRKPSKEKRNKKWGDPDRAKLLYLLDTGKVDITLELDNVRSVHSEYFEEHKYKNFAKNFRAFATDYTLGEEFDGARLREFCESFPVTPVLLVLFLPFSYVSDRKNPVVEDGNDFIYDEDDNITDDDDIITDDNNNQDVMAPPAASKPAAKKKKSSDAPKATKAPPPLPSSFSLFTGDSYEKTRYVENDIEFVEVEIFVNGCLPNHAYQAYLDPDKKVLFWKRGTPKAVFSSERLRQLMAAGTYHANHTRVVAHGDTHQEILASNPETIQGWYFNDFAQSIELGCTVVGEPAITYSNYAVCQIEGGQTQHNTIYSFIYQVARQRIHEKKKATKTAILTLALNDDDEDEGPTFLPFAAAPCCARPQAATTSNSNAKTGKKPAKRSAGGDGYDDDGSSSEDHSDDDDDEDMDVKPPAVTTKKAKREVKAEPRRTARHAACIEIVDDDSDYS